MESELQFNTGLGITAWLVEGLKIQEHQCVMDQGSHQPKLTCTGQV
jgi:hypothetical protein